MTLPTRFIACVDGTWGTPDGTYGSRHQNISNIYRVCASIKEGPCIDEHSRIEYYQKKEYFPGIGSAEDIGRIDRLKAGITGFGIEEQIRNVYEKCCMLSDHPQNEVWLFGFSRGAFAVRAVAGILHYFRALKSAGTKEFAEDYKATLRHYRALRGQGEVHLGSMHNHLATTSRPAPRIKFVGVLDTVKAVSDKFLYDITFNGSIQHLRHALALHEDRKDFEPECLWGDPPRNRRSLVQAWFVGAHIDMGGSADKDGLSLYPLQWMLLESRDHGLALEFDGSFGNRARIDNPLELVLGPQSTSNELYESKMKNGLIVKMHDIRRMHDHDRYNGRYQVHLNRNKRIFWRRDQRKPFTGDSLDGFFPFAPHGTILHPSVYLIFDEYSTILLNSNDLLCKSNIEKSRQTFLPVDGYWAKEEMVQIEEPTSVRILVCGNSGIGKSTLINKVFGVELATTSDRTRGVHDIREPITCPGREDLIIHDSEGFESGSFEELEKVKSFITEMSTFTTAADRLHVIWFCIEINTARALQKATLDLFSVCSENAEIPIVVVGTKKDEFWDLQYIKAQREKKSEKQRSVYADDQLRQRMMLMEQELLDVKDGRCDIVIAVSKDDETSLQDLTTETARCFDSAKVRQGYVAAQTRNIDLKVDSAISETMRIYKNSIKSAASLGMVPGGSSANRVSVATAVCQAILNSFGLRHISAKIVNELIKNLIWDDMPNNLTIFAAEILAGAGLVGTLILSGMPVFLVAGAVNVPLVVPATGRLVLMLACDVILILARAFKECIEHCIGQPQCKHVEKAALAYRGLSKDAHNKIEALVKRRNVVKSFRFEQIGVGFSQVVKSKTKEFVEGVGTGSSLNVARADDDTLSEISTNTLVEPVKDMRI